MNDGLAKIDDRLRELENYMASNKTTLEWISEMLSSLNVKVGIQNGRVTKLENWKVYLVGIVGGIGMVISFVTLIISTIKH